MTKTVAKRSWSVEKFTAAVKAACERAGTRFASSKVGKAYDDGWTVAYTVAQFANANSRPAAAKASTKKAA